MPQTALLSNHTQSGLAKTCCLTQVRILYVLPLSWTEVPFSKVMLRHVHYPFFYNMSILGEITCWNTMYKREGRIGPFSVCQSVFLHLSRIFAHLTSISAQTPSSTSWTRRTAASRTRRSPPSSWQVSPHCDCDPLEMPHIENVIPPAVRRLLHRGLLHHRVLHAACHLSQEDALLCTAGKEQD